jgi:ribulose-phosphate 3-epimerase
MAISSPTSAWVRESPERIRQLRGLIDRLNPACELEVDGGIEVDNTALVTRAGATVLVVGTGIFHYPAGPTRAVGELLARSRM